MIGVFNNTQESPSLSPEDIQKGSGSEKDDDMRTKSLLDSKDIYISDVDCHRKIKCINHKKGKQEGPGRATRLV